MQRAASKRNVFCQLVLESDTFSHWEACTRARAKLLSVQVLLKNLGNLVEPCAQGVTGEFTENVGKISGEDSG